MELRGWGRLFVARAFARFIVSVSCVVSVVGVRISVALDYAPDRAAVPVTRTIEIEGRLNDHVQFLYNRGKGSVNFRDHLLDMLDPAAIRALPGFTSFKDVLIDVSAYEFRLLETIPKFVALIKLGASLRFTLDPSTFTPFKGLSKAQLAKLSPRALANYLKNFDEDRDGVITKKDKEAHYFKHMLAIEAYKKLEALRERVPARVELISPPLEYVSNSELLNFSRLHHLKRVGIHFRRQGVWHPVEFMDSSANPTDSCMSKRVAISKGNKLRYLAGNFAETNYAKGSQGNVQFGAMLRGEGLLTSLQSVSENWIELYKKKKHFDQGKVSETILPRIVIRDPNGHRTSVESYHSEGTNPQSRKTVDPVLAAIHHLTGPEKSLRVYYSTQFVSTHPAKNHALRYLIDKAGDKMEDFFVVVDGNFANHPFSALPQLAFAPSLSLQYGTMEGKSIRDLPALPQKLGWEESIGVYEGTQGVYGADGDKLHAKVDYYEYETASGERHYVVVWGSANSSKNAGRGNADLTHVLDTTDPAVGRQVKQYFRALRNDPRVFPYSLAYLDVKFRTAFNWDQRILNEDFLKVFADTLSGKPGSQNLKSLIGNLSEAKVHSDFGANLLSLLKWFEANSGKAISWEDFHILTEISHPQKLVTEALSADLGKRWLVSSKPAMRSLRLRLDQLKKTEKFGVISKNMNRILSNCSEYLRALGIQKTPKDFFLETP